ncbi:prp 4 CRoW domain-containing protein [Purpureocillium lilacinum]|uniref:Prp 4 CRoW domain-containing protein n=1 Tax=Purpureocillium lilacinum TaxID=33203 RepID=A0A179HZU2_PURLI|nr:prp 4 CRoW domain-containing protein [Purpureocillium lilacinum]KAK4087588.1 hypothetical protein Purlil1_8178 [Purpureocillium lilacinum]OAQ86976.1 prp 4 CRoW domain-containing protein [Purpureocillium lilacinum]OAQ94939.1 prp 4 CRoW domain-containing protein [Purpureocillium lilacinum]PWI70355.1 prp 4 CRoW domain-containing protein [Purpureocillium lilacinum]GJN66802.1 hypothetical protein PLICBS_000824 [Purpureocillium lilacinum]
MHFLASVTVLAASIAGAAASPQKMQPYRLAVMPLPGQSLQRRDTNGYVPETTQCGKGNTCAEACGAGYDQCTTSDNVAHCFNPAAGDSCCTDGSGNSCAKGYYCTHDHSKRTWCCPESMDLAACAAAYTITGGLEQARSTTKPSTTSTPPPTTSSTSTSTTPTTTSKPSTTSIAIVTETKDKNTTVCPSSSGYTTAWTGANSTITTAQPTQPSAVVPSGTKSLPPPPPTNVNAAAATGVSALLLVAAGVVALL